MSNYSYNVLLDKYNKLKKEIKKEPIKELNSVKERYYYYFNAYQKQKEDNEKLKNENKRLKKQNIELSYLITELLRGKNNE